VSRRFRVKSPNVMHETIEGEVIVIDLATGSYYSLRDAGAEIWHGIEHGIDEAGIGDSLERRYEGPRDEILAAVRRLLDALAAEDLIEPSDADAAAPTMPPLQHTNGRLPFLAPVLEKHSDMQDLILLDPVHKVGPQGWPHPAEPETRE
jgi:Coenzyme PQQ synthesis protein D (PqqD)